MNITTLSWIRLDKINFYFIFFSFVYFTLFENILFMVSLVCMYFVVFGCLFLYCSTSEVRHPNEVRHLHFMTILKSFYCPITAYMYTLTLKEAIPFI